MESDREYNALAQAARRFRRKGKVRDLPDVEPMKRVRNVPFADPPAPLANPITAEDLERARREYLESKANERKETNATDPEPPAA